MLWPNIYISILGLIVIDELLSKETGFVSMIVTYLEE